MLGWVVVVSNSWDCFWTSGIGQTLRAQTDLTNNARWTIQQNRATQIYVGIRGAKVYFSGRTLCICSYSPEKKRSQTVQRLFPDCKSHFLAKRRSKTRPSHQGPGLSSKCPQYYANTLVSWWYRGGAYENPLSDRDFYPAHLGTSRHKLSVQGCLDMSNWTSYILKCTFLLWGKNSHRDGWPDLRSTAKTGRDANC